MVNKLNEISTKEHPLQLSEETMRLIKEVNEVCKLRLYDLQGDNRIDII